MMTVDTPLPQGEDRKKRCDQLKGAMASALRTQARERERIAELRGVDSAAYARLATDAGALVESAVDFVAESRIPILDGIRGSAGLEIANRSTNIYAGGAAVVDVINAYASFVGDRPDWGGVSYNLGSAEVNALSLYLGPGAKGFASNPWTGIGVGASALAIGLAQEIAITNIKNSAIDQAKAGHDSAADRGGKAAQEFDQLNCSELY